jgi:glucose dehydrogenase
LAKIARKFAQRLDPVRATISRAMSRHLRRVLSAISLLAGSMALMHAQDITSKDLRDGLANPARWLTYSGDYDAMSGRRRWRFWAVPQPGEPGGDTWPGDMSERGGGPTWLTGTYDPDLNLLYWGIGNPNPDFYGANRAPAPSAR